jgi:AhpD family alkylhydroperoxidase
MSDVAPGGEDEPDRRRDRTRALERVPAPGAIGEPRAEEHRNTTQRIATSLRNQCAICGGKHETAGAARGGDQTEPSGILASL